MDDVLHILYHDIHVHHRYIQANSLCIILHVSLVFGARSGSPHANYMSWLHTWYMHAGSECNLQFMSCISYFHTLSIHACMTSATLLCITINIMNQMIYYSYTVLHRKHFCWSLTLLYNSYYIHTLYLAGSSCMHVVFTRKAISFNVMSS